MSKRTIAVLTLLVAATSCAGSDSTDDTLGDAPAESAETGADDPIDTAVLDDDTVPDTAPSDTAPADTTPLETVAADEGNPAVTTPTSGPPPSSPTALYEADDIDNGLRPFIEQALADLAQRLEVDPADIVAHAAVLVTWPDSSLGCPQPGMSYAQAQMDGSVIELEYDGSYFRYHTGGSRGPFLCETPITKAPPTEGLSISDGADD